MGYIKGKSKARAKDSVLHHWQTFLLPFQPIFIAAWIQTLEIKIMSQWFYQVCQWISSDVALCLLAF
jgi:hypothetical protein